MSLSTIADISHPRQSESMNDAVLARAEICDILQHALGGQISFIEAARSVN
jgi:hypothetical protein